MGSGRIEEQPRRTDSDGWYRRLFEQAPSGILVFDLTFHVTACNPLFAEWLGVKVAQIVGLDLATLHDTRPLPPMRAALRGETTVYDGPYQTMVTRREMSIRMVSAPLRDADGTLVGGISTFEDVSVRREAERALLESEERYRQVVELAPEPIFVQVDRRIAFANPATLRAFRANSPSDFVGHEIKDFVLRELNEVVAARLTRVDTGEAVGFMEQGFVRVDGSIGDGEVASIPMTFEGKRAILTVARDISARKAAERAREDAFREREAAVTAERATDARARAVFRAVPVPTYAWQRVAGKGKEDFVLVEYNDAALRITRGAIADVVGKSVFEIHASVPEITRDVAATLAGSVPVHREMDFLFRSGDKRRLSVTYIPVPPELVLVYTEDITQRSELEDQLRQAQKMEAVGLLAGGVAHDFNNLLTVIQYYADGLITALGERDRLAADADEIRKAAARAATLTRQLLAFSRKQVLQPRSVDVNVIVESVQTMLRRLIGEDIRIERVAAEPLGRVRADPGQLEQVLLNLALNARDAMPRGGTLTFETAQVDVGHPSPGPTWLPPGTYARLSVRDTGHGMDEATRARIFEPFFTTKEAGRGTGLGLSTVYGIVNQSGGTIKVESAPNEGTTFHILLPVYVDAEKRISEPGAPVPPREGQELILLAEDEDAVRAIARRILEGAGYRVLEARDGRDALRVAAGITGRLDLLVTDMVMPELGGRELYDELHVTHPELRVLYMSGYTDDEILRRGDLDAGSVFLQKPFSADELRQLLRLVLDAKATEPPQ